MHMMAPIWLEAGPALTMQTRQRSRMASKAALNFLRSALIRSSILAEASAFFKIVTRLIGGLYLLVVRGA